MTRPDRADFAGSIITHGKDEIEMRRTGQGKLIPALAAKSACWQLGVLQDSEGELVNHALWSAARAESQEPAGAQMVKNAFGKDARGIAGAVKRTL